MLIGDYIDRDVDSGKSSKIETQCVNNNHPKQSNHHSVFE
jgi:hypothetical protein